VVALARRCSDHPEAAGGQRLRDPVVVVDCCRLGAGHVLVRIVERRLGLDKKKAFDEMEAHKKKRIKDALEANKARRG